MQIAGQFYHESCVSCCICGLKLARSCFFRDCKLYCKLDYDRLYCKKCLACAEGIPAEELVMRASDFIFHLRCFVCVVCGVRLQKGDQFIIKQGQLFCKPDYEKEVEMMQGFIPGDYICDDGILSARSHDGRRGPKRPRTILTTQQRRAFKASFEISPKPCRKVRETLAKDTGLSVRIVQVWFQNQRAKVKKMQKKAKQENKSNNVGNNGSNSNGSDSDCTTADKTDYSLKEGKSPDTTGMSSYVNDSCSDSEQVTIPSRETFHHNISLKERMNNGEYHFYKPIDRKDPMNNFIPSQQSNFMMREEGMYNRLPIMGNMLQNENADLLIHQHQLHINSIAPTAISMNPIDRLYSMQNTYFCGEESALLE